MADNFSGEDQDEGTGYVWDTCTRFPIWWVVPINDRGEPVEGTGIAFTEYGAQQFQDDREADGNDFVVIPIDLAMPDIPCRFALHRLVGTASVKVQQATLSVFGADSETEATGTHEDRRTVPNVDEVTGDTVLAPMEIRVPMVLIENSIGDRYWHHEAMDRSAAERMASMISAGRGTQSAQIVDVPVVMPCAGDVVDVLNKFDAEPCRARLTEIVTPDPFARIAEGVRCQS